ncbi:MAG: methyltransferase [Methanothrix sp.]|uniref:Putative methylase n=2 Tax=Methanotrichaceae TaxID=143067 RepID=A0B5V2_METTP|nr:putative methylase [Methanothrix thermoacetophila PT]MBC7080174.1 methyltransferase [Methanothrix sp.]NPU87900.1 methyltransferase [Methanothrix sp.]
MVDVYPPSEDTYLLMRAAISEASAGDSVIEIGCGSGVISASLIGKVRSILATDINPHAVRAAASLGIPAVRADLFHGINSKFDLILFNPPYLPTEDGLDLNPEDDRWLSTALDGGADGREVIERFLKGVKNIMSPRGRLLLLISSLTGLDEVQELARRSGFNTEIVAMERYFFEELYVLKLRRAE